MNKECYADILIVDGNKYLRCLWDGVIIKIENTVPEICPNCNRKIDVHNEFKNLKVRIVKQVLYPVFDDWKTLPNTEQSGARDCSLPVATPDP